MKPREGRGQQLAARGRQFATTPSVSTLEPASSSTTGGPRFPISEVVRVTGVSPARLRGWERAALLSPHRSPRGIRLYSLEEVARIRLIARVLAGPRKRGDVRALAARLAAGELSPEPRDYAGVDADDTPAASAAPSPEKAPAAHLGCARASVPTSRLASSRRRPTALPPLADVVDLASPQALDDSKSELVALLDSYGVLRYANTPLRSYWRRHYEGDMPLGQPMEALRVSQLDGTLLTWSGLRFSRPGYSRASQCNMVLVRQQRDGRARYMLWNAAPITATWGELLGALAVGRDITDERRQREHAGPLGVLDVSDVAASEHLQLEEQDDWIATAAHDLRSPVAAILLNLQYALRTARILHPPTADKLSQESDEGDVPLTPGRRVKRLQRSLEVAEARTHDLIRRMETVLDATAAQTGTLSLHYKPGGVDLCQLVRNACAHLRVVAAQHTVEFDVPSRPVRVMGDEERLRQLLENLLDNAAKYSPDGGRIVVRLTVEPAAPDRPQPWVVLRVKDEGVGIPAADVPHIFERYRRAGGAARAMRGTGLGLFTCHAIAEAHGGRIWVDRTAVAAEQSHPDAVRGSVWHGTVMALSLPLAGIAEVRRRGG